MCLMGSSSYDNDSFDFLTLAQTLEALNGCLTSKIKDLEHQSHVRKIKIIIFLSFYNIQESKVHFIFMKTEPSYTFFNTLA